MKAVLNTYYNEPLSVERRIRKPVSHRKQQKDYDHKDKAMGRGIVINDEERHNVRIGIEIIPKDIQNEIIQRCITNDHHENSKETELNQNPEYGHTDPYDDLYYHYSMCRNVSKLWRILSDRCYDQVQHMSRYHKKHMDWIALQACYARRIVFARIILDTKKQSRSTKLLSNYALPYACHNGYEDVVTLLMRYTEVDPTFEDYSALILASEKGSDGIIKILMDRCKACTGLREAVCKMLIKACYFGHLNVITTLLDYPNVQKTFYEGSNPIFTKKRKNKLSKEAIVPHYVSTKMLDKACENSHKDVIIYLLNHPKIVFYNYFPVCSYRDSEEDMEIIELFLDRRNKDGDMRINPSAMNNRAIHVACDKNQPMILARLLKEPDVDPGYENNLALRFSCIEGRIQLIKVLLSDHRVDPKVLNNKELLWIFRMRPSKELVSLLLSIPEVDPGANENMILKYMIRDRPSWELIELLIQHPKVDPSVNDNELFRLVAQSEGERPEKLETLLQHPKIDPSANDNEALKSYILANYDNSEGLRILLNDPRVDPCSEEYRPLMNACKVRNYTNLELLLFDHRVIRSVVDSCERNRPRSQPSKISVDATGSSNHNQPDVTITNFSTLFSTPFQPCDPLSEYAVELFKYARKRDHKGVQSRKDNDDDQEYQRSILSPIQHKTRLADLLTRNGLSMSGCFPDLEELLIRITDVFIGYSINKDTIPVIFGDILKRFHNLITTSILAGIDAPK